MPQFNMNTSTTDRWYTLTYQSNDLLNVQVHNQAKREIAQIIVNTVHPTQIHSYIHGHIIFSVNTTRPVTELERIIEALSRPLAARVPRLLFSVALVAKENTNPGRNFMFVEGDADMDRHFLESIRDFYP